MNVESNTCNAARIARFLRHDLSDAELGALVEHLDACPACSARLEAETAEQNWWHAASEYLADSPFELEPLADQPVPPDAPAQSLMVQQVLDQLAPTDDPRMLGRIGTYEVAGVVGAGGMGVVLKAWDPALDRYVAIKTLSPALAASGSARQRFAREARAAAAVVHDNVSEIYGVAEANGLPYLVMPYVRGTSLQRRLDDSGPLTVAEVLRIGMQTAAGLAAAHAQGLVHRDIKPANILLSEGVERVQITDFGLARAADDASLTRTGVLAGTPQYMSPEQARGEAVDHRSDLFSLGSVLYATCTGRPPFRAESSYGILRRITDSEPRPIREINPDIPDWLVAIIAKLHAKDPAGRFASAKEVAELLEGSLAHWQQPASVPLPAALPAPAVCRTLRLRKTLVKGIMAMIAIFEIALLGILAVHTPEPPDIAGHSPPTPGRTPDGPAKLVRTEYDIGPLWAGEGNSARAEDMIDLITSVVHPEAWDEVGGPGTIAATNEKRLSILQTPAIHAQVAKLLEVLKKMPALQPRGAAREPPKHYVVNEGRTDADLSLVVYDVTDLVPADDYDSIVRAVVDFEPSTWNHVGGAGCCAVCPQAKALVIVQTGTVQRHLQNSLRLYRRKPAAFGSFGPPASAQDQKTAAQRRDAREQLEQRISLSLEAVPLPKALSQLAEKLRTNIVLDDESIRQAGLDPGAPVTVHVQVPERASAILKLILQPRKLGYVADGSSIKITTPEVVESTLDVRVYPVGDLLTPTVPVTPLGEDQPDERKPDQRRPKAQHDFRSLISLITGTVEPTSWDGVGGPGKIEPFESRSSLVITQTQPVHEQIADLLDELRQPSVRPPTKPAESLPAEPPQGGGGASGGFFSTEAGSQPAADVAISVCTAVASSPVAPAQDHVRFVALRQAAGQDIPGQRLPALGHSCGGLWYLPDGKTLVSTFGGIDQLPGRPVPNDDPRVGQVTFWDTSTWETKAALGTGAKRLIRGASLAISPDGSRLAVLAENQFVAVWDISPSPLPENPVWKDAWEGGRNATRWVHCVAFSPDGAWIASLQSRRSSPTARICEYPLVLYDAASGRPEHEVELRAPSGHEVVFSPDGRTLAVTATPARQKYLLQFVDTVPWKIVKGVDLDEPIGHLPVDHVKRENRFPHQRCRVNTLPE